MIECSVPSVSVAVARDGKIIWEEAFGWADRENRIAATPHTLYSLASISKLITATGLMILKERGKIDLDRPINDYLGDAKLRVRVGNPADATVHRVANHTSGLPLHYQFFYEDEPYRAPSRDETIRRYILSLSLKLRGDVLNGAITAQSTPAKRVGNALTHWVELKKQTPKPYYKPSNESRDICIY